MAIKRITVYSRNLVRGAAKGIIVSTVAVGVGGAPALQAADDSWDIDPDAARHLVKAFAVTTATGASEAYHEIDVGLGAEIVFDEDAHQSERYGPRRGVIIGRFR